MCVGWNFGIGGVEVIWGGNDGWIGSDRGFGLLFGKGRG